MEATSPNRGGSLSPSLLRVIWLRLRCGSSCPSSPSCGRLFDPRRLTCNDLPAVRTLRTSYQDPEDIQMVVDELSRLPIPKVRDTFCQRHIAVDADCRVTEFHEPAFGCTPTLDGLQH